MAHDSQNPAYVIVGGVSHTPAFFDTLIRELNALGYVSKAVAYPTIGDTNFGTGQKDEVKAIQDTIEYFVDAQNKDVVLLLHSYGGWPGSRAVKGYDKESRDKQGKKYGIREIVFLAAFLLPDNAPMAKYSHLPPWISVKVSAPKILLSLDCATALCTNGV